MMDYYDDDPYEILRSMTEEEKRVMFGDAPDTIKPLWFSLQALSLGWLEPCPF